MTGDILQDGACKLKKSIAQKDDAPDGGFFDRVLLGQRSYNDEEMKPVKNILISDLKKFKLPFGPHLSNPSCFLMARLKSYCSSTEIAFREFLLTSFPSFVQRKG